MSTPRIEGVLLKLINKMAGLRWFVFSQSSAWRCVSSLSRCPEPEVCSMLLATTVLQ